MTYVSHFTLSLSPLRPPPFPLLPLPSLSLQALLSHLEADPKLVHEDVGLSPAKVHTLWCILQLVGIVYTSLLFSPPSPLATSTSWQESHCSHWSSSQAYHLKPDIGVGVVSASSSFLTPYFTPDISLHWWTWKWAYIQWTSSTDSHRWVWLTCGRGQLVGVVSL